MRLNPLTLSALGAAVVLACSPGVAHADVLVGDLGDARLIDEPSGARNDNNGGNTISGALIGINPGGIDNFMVYDFSDLSAASGITVTGATVSVFVNTAYSAGVHGSAADTIVLSEIALPNVGWDKGTGVITGADTPADDGSVSFSNRVQFNGSGTTEAWKDAGGSDVADLTGALSTLDTTSGWSSGSAPIAMTFTIDAVTAQSWVDNGLGGLALNVIDDGNGNSRFNMAQAGATINFIEVPEPGSMALLGLGGLLLGTRRRR